MKNIVSISVIIPTYNRAAILPMCLDSVVKQDYPQDKYEILVVDNGSTDNTKQTVKEAIATYLSHQIRYIFEPELGLLSGRHRGALEAKGEILTFIDDDIEADIGWLQAIQESFEDSSVQLVGGRNLPRYKVDPPEWLDWFWLNHSYGRYCVDLSLLDFGDQAREIDANYVWGLNFSIRKQALFDLGGFHPDCIPRHLQHFQGDGETGVTQKANQYEYKAIYQPKALVFHQISRERMTHHYFDQRYFYQGVCDSYSEIRQRHGLSKQVYVIAKFKNLLRPYKRAIITLSRKKTEKSILRERFWRAYQKGYLFHQSAVHKNPELLAWVLKKDYWDYTLPNLEFTGDTFISNGKEKNRERIS
jgi:glycosyltransferase involved in cell wall biosynthesis